MLTSCERILARSRGKPDPASAPPERRQCVSSYGSPLLGRQHTHKSSKVPSESCQQLDTDENGPEPARFGVVLKERR